MRTDRSARMLAILLAAVLPGAAAMAPPDDKARPPGRVGVGAHVTSNVPDDVRAAIGKNAEVETHFREGNQKLGRREPAEAAAAFVDAARIADRSGDSTASAEALIRSVKATLTLDATTPELARLDQAANLASQAAVKGNPTQKVAAQSYLGLIRMRQGRYGDAVKVLSEVSVDDVPRSQRFVVDFNLGRALELDKRDDAARAHYVRAIQANPRHAPSVDRFFDVVLRGPAKAAIDPVRETSRALLGAGQANQAAAQLRRCLDAWAKNDAAVKALLPELVDAYVASRLDPEAFQTNEWPALEPLGKHDLLSTPVREIGKAYLADFTPPMPSMRLGDREQFPYWSSELEERGRRAFSALLALVGDCYFVQVAQSGVGDDPAALRERKLLHTLHRAKARYLSAWAMSHDNTGALVSLAAVLRDYTQSVEDGREVYERLLGTLFSEKGGLYSIPVKTPSDWDNIMRMHFLLGSLFEREEKWGSEHEPRSAIFQWAHALEAARRTSDGRPVSPTPGLKRHLAEAYAHDPETLSKALDLFLEASGEFLELRDPPAARATLERASALALQFGPTDAQRQRLTRLQRDAGPKGGNASPPD